MDQGTTLLGTTVILTAAVTAKRGVSPTGGTPAAAGRCLGPSTTDGAIGAAVNVVSMGTSPWESGGAFARGDKLQIDASGRVVVFAAGVFVAVAQEASTGAGQFPECLVVPN